MSVPPSGPGGRKMSVPPSRFLGMPEFVPLAERIVDAILESDPGLASYAGGHLFDDRMPDLSPGGVAARTAMLRDAADALAGIDPDALEPEDHVDHAILAAV